MHVSEIALINQFIDRILVTILRGSHITPELGLPTEPVIHTECHVAGWGKTEEHGQSPVILSTTISVMSKAYCNTHQGLMYKRLTGVFSFCAGLDAGGNDSCQGDSGGPLYCKQGASYVLYGITSKGGRCGAEKQPGIYTKVSNIVPWIQKHTEGTYLNI